jgi:hypothetical protein
VAEEDAKAAAVFDLTWEHLSAQEREAFAVLALAPGEDVGANLLRAWQRQTSGGGRPARVLVELANASLLNPVAGRKGRYRYHDRVRDYALTKLPLPKDEARRRLLACWTDWDTVKAEFEAVGAAGLAMQYLRLRSWEVEEPAEFAPWFHFARGQASVLDLLPELFFQQAFNEAAGSPVSRAARVRVGTAEEPRRWLEWENRPLEWVRPACLMVLRGHLTNVFSVAVSADGRTAVSGSHDRRVRVWDLSGGSCTAVLEGHTEEVTSVAVSADGRTAVSGAADNTVRVWDLAGGRCTAILEGHTGWVRSVAVSADGRTAVSGAADNTVRVWDLAGGRCISSHAEGSEESRRAWVTANSGLAATTVIDREPHSLTLRDTTSGTILARFPGSFIEAACSPDVRNVVAGDVRGSVYLLRLHTRPGYEAE